MSNQESSTPMPSGWKPFSPYDGYGRPQIVDRVTLLRSGSIRLSDDIVDRLGKPAKVQMLTNESKHVFAVCPASTPAGSAALSKVGRQREFRVNRLMTSLGRDVERINWPLELTHWWDGGLLIIDVSSVPTVAS